MSIKNQQDKTKKQKVRSKPQSTPFNRHYFQKTLGMIRRIIIYSET
ncbi:hypothetical protein IFVP203_C210072 [Vibrio parahaemolyticus]